MRSNLGRLVGGSVLCECVRCDREGVWSDVVSAGTISTGSILVCVVGVCVCGGCVCVCCVWCGAWASV